MWLAFLSITVPWGELDARDDEKEILAYYVYNFLLFVDWPERTPGARDVVTLLILGDRELGEALLRLEGKSMKNRRLNIRMLDKPEEISGGNALFISAERKAELPVILKSVRGLPVLTLSDLSTFAREGGMVALLGTPREAGRDGKHFEINRAAVESAGIRIRSRLMRLSVVIEEKAAGE